MLGATVHKAELAVWCGCPNLERSVIKFQSVLRNALWKEKHNAVCGRNQELQRQAEQYLLGHSEEEELRLRRQAEELRQESARLFDRIGIGAGSRQLISVVGRKASSICSQSASAPLDK